MDRLTGGANEIRDRNFIGGRWVAAHDARTFDVLDPASGEHVAAIADSGSIDA